MSDYITQEQALEFARNNPDALTKAFSAGKRLYIGVDISDMAPGEQFSYLNPKDAPKADIDGDGKVIIKILEGAPLVDLQAKLTQAGFTSAVKEKTAAEKYDKTVNVVVEGVDLEGAKNLIKDIGYTSQTVTNAGPEGLVNVIQASVSDAQATEILAFWSEQGRTKQDYLNLVEKIAAIQVRDGATLGDVYDEKAAKLTNIKRISGNNIAETAGFAGDANYVRGQTEVRIIASEDYVLEGSGSKKDQYVNGKGILIFDLKDGNIVGVRSSAEDHATKNGNFLDETGAALTTLDGVKHHSVKSISFGATEENFEIAAVAAHVQLMKENGGTFIIYGGDQLEDLHDKAREIMADPTAMAKARTDFVQNKAVVEAHNAPNTEALGGTQAVSSLEAKKALGG